MEFIKRLEKLQILGVENNTLYSKDKPLCKVKGIQDIKVYFNNASVEVLNDYGRTIRIIPLKEIHEGLNKNKVYTLAEVNSVLMGLA